MLFFIAIMLFVMSKPILSGASFNHYLNRSTVKPRQLDTLRLALWKPWDIVQSHVRFNMDFGGGRSETLDSRSKSALSGLENPLEDVGNAGLGIHDLAHGVEASSTGLWEEHKVTLAEAAIRQKIIGLPLLKTIKDALALLYPECKNPGMEAIASEFNQYVPLEQRQLFPEVMLRPWLTRFNHLMEKIQYQLPTKKQYLAHLAAPIHSYADRRVLQKLGAVRVPRNVDWNA